MAREILIIGMGYTGERLADALRVKGWGVTGVRRQASSPGIVAFDNEPMVRNHIARASHILSSVPPDRSGQDPVLERYGMTIAASGAAWTGYLSSTGVYGDTGGAWVDESAPIGSGRRTARSDADLRWQTLRPDMRVFRLPGIYGPGRNILERLSEGKAHRINLPDQVFSRVHVEDIVSVIIASFDAPHGIYNVADDHPCSQNNVVEFGSALLGIEPPPLITLEQAGLSPQARAFYSENRRVANGKAKRQIAWRPLYPDYREGLLACLRA